MKSLHAIFKHRPSPAETSSVSRRWTTPVESHFVSLIHESNSESDLRCVHAQILRNGQFRSSRIVAQLISSSFSSHRLRSASYPLSIFRLFEDKNLFVFNALIRGLAENSDFRSSVFHFVLMLRLGVRPDQLTFPFVLESNTRLGFYWLGVTLHSLILKFGVGFDSFVRVSLVDMYVKIGKLGLAQKVFDESPSRLKNESILLWNVLINGLCRKGDLTKATELFESMPERNVGSWNCVMNGLMNSGDLDGAKKLFDQMPEKNVVSWTTMINGFSKIAEYIDAISMFFKMLEDGTRPNAYTIASTLAACAKIGAFDSGSQIHDYISSNGLKLEGAVGTALVDMYAKCGRIESAYTVFGKIKHKDLLTWTAMIHGWAMQGLFEKSINCFKQMMYSGEKPDETLFVVILTACLNVGEVNLGLNFFESMRLDYSIEPTMKHYALVVDLLGRAGKLSEAVKLIDKVPVNVDFTVWVSLYRACKTHKKTKMAQSVLQRILEIDPIRVGCKILLSNILAAEGRWEDMHRMRMLLKKTSNKDRILQSYIELNGEIHRLTSGDSSHERSEEIQLKLEEIISDGEEKGLMLEVGDMIQNITEEEGEDVVGLHSEKLALGLGILKSDPGTTIRITKEIRVCGNCHSFMKFASLVSQREIILRDARRFHCFKDGFCSCGDYW